MSKKNVGIQWYKEFSMITAKHLTTNAIVFQLNEEHTEGYRNNWARGMSLVSVSRHEHIDPQFISKYRDRIVKIVSKYLSNFTASQLNDTKGKTIIINIDNAELFESVLNSGLSHTKKFALMVLLSEFNLNDLTFEEILKMIDITQDVNVSVFGRVRFYGLNIYPMIASYNDHIYLLNSKRSKTISFKVIARNINASIALLNGDINNVSEYDPATTVVSDHVLSINGIEAVIQGSVYTNAEAHRITTLRKAFNAEQFLKYFANSVFFTVNSKNRYNNPELLLPLLYKVLSDPDAISLRNDWSDPEEAINVFTPLNSFGQSGFKNVAEVLTKMYREQNNRFTRDIIFNGILVEDFYNNPELLIFGIDNADRILDFSDDLTNMYKSFIESLISDENSIVKNSHRFNYAQRILTVYFFRQLSSIYMEGVFEKYEIVKEFAPNRLKESTISEDYRKLYKSLVVDGYQLPIACLMSGVDLALTDKGFDFPIEFRTV